MSKNFTGNVFATSSKEAIDLFLKRSDSKVKLTDILTELSPDQLKRSIICSPSYNENLISFEMSFAYEKKEGCVTRFRFLETGSFFELQYLNKDLISERLKELLFRNNIDNEQNRVDLEADAIEVVKGQRYIYFAFGVGDDVSNWAGPFVGSLIDTEVIFNENGGREITLKFHTSEGKFLRDEIEGPGSKNIYRVLDKYNNIYKNKPIKINYFVDIGIDHIKMRLVHIQIRQLITKYIQACIRSDNNNHNVIVLLPDMDKLLSYWVNSENVRGVVVSGTNDYSGFFRKLSLDCTKFYVNARTQASLKEAAVSLGKRHHWLLHEGPEEEASKSLFNRIRFVEGKFERDAAAVLRGDEGEMRRIEKMFNEQAEMVKRSLDMVQLELKEEEKKVHFTVQMELFDKSESKIMAGQTPDYYLPLSKFNNNLNTLMKDKFNLVYNGQFIIESDLNIINLWNKEIFSLNHDKYLQSINSSGTTSYFSTNMDKAVEVMGVLFGLEGRRFAEYERDNNIPRHSGHSGGKNLIDSQGSTSRSDYAAKVLDPNKPVFIFGDKDMIEELLYASNHQSISTVNEIPKNVTEKLSPSEKYLYVDNKENFRNKMFLMRKKNLSTHSLQTNKNDLLTLDDQLLLDSAARESIKLLDCPVFRHNMSNANVLSLQIDNLISFMDVYNTGYSERSLIPFITDSKHIGNYSTVDKLNFGATNAGHHRIGGHLSTDGKIMRNIYDLVLQQSKIDPTITKDLNKLFQFIQSKADDNSNIIELRMLGNLKVSGEQGYIGHRGEGLSLDKLTALFTVEIAKKLNWGQTISPQIEFLKHQELIEFEKELFEKMSNKTIRVKIKTLPWFSINGFMNAHRCILIGFQNLINQFNNKKQKALYTGLYFIQGYRHFISPTEMYSEFLLSKSFATPTDPQSLATNPASDSLGSPTNPEAIPHTSDPGAPGATNIRVTD